MPYTLNTTVHPLDEAAVEVSFKVTNFEEAVLLTPNGAYLRSKAFCIGGGRFCLRVYPSGEKGKPGVVSAYLQNLTKNEFDVDLKMSVNEVVSKTLTSEKVEAKKSWGWKFGEAAKIGDTLLLVARVYVWENYSTGEVLSTKTEKMELLTKDDLKSQEELMKSGVKTEEKQTRTEVKQMRTEVKQLTTEVKQLNTELKQVKAEVVSDMVQMKTEVKKLKAEVVKVKAETKTEVLNLKSEVVKMKNELISELKELKELLSEVKDEAIQREAKSKEDFARFESQFFAEMRSQPTMPECRICMQFLSPPTRIIMCQMGHKLCESCWMKPGLVNCPDHCDTPFIGRDLGMEAFLRQLTGRQH